MRFPPKSPTSSHLPRSKFHLINTLQVVNSMGGPVQLGILIGYGKSQYIVWGVQPGILRVWKIIIHSMGFVQLGILIRYGKSISYCHIGHISPLWISKSFLRLHKGEQKQLRWMSPPGKASQKIWFVCLKKKNKRPQKGHIYLYIHKNIYFPIFEGSSNWWEFLINGFPNLDAHQVGP